MHFSDFDRRLMDRLASLNPAQQSAVTTLSGPVLVLAGAGTGKTRVITYRMVELIKQGIAPDRILSVTFTNKAAREMLNRTKALLGSRLKKKPLISTFHSFCVRVLRQDIDSLGYPKAFTIYDRGEQESVARTALRDIRVGDKGLRPGDLLSRISQWKMHGILPDFTADYIENDLDFISALAYRKYQQKLRASGAVDFDDLLLLTGQLFEQFPDVLARHQSRFDHVQIDEYQDTNGTQFHLIEALVRKHQNLCVVGDDDQSIYGWRGADVTHILNFGVSFPGAKIVRLEDNYRCTDKIIDVANRLVSFNKGRHEKVLIPHKISDDEVRIEDFDDEVTEAESIVREINYLHRTQEIPASNFAILFRTNEQPRLFETELRKAKLPYQLVGSQSFFDRKEIRDLLAYLKVFVHPTDEVSLLRIINTPARGIGNSTVEKLLARAVSQGTSLWNIIPDAVRAGDLNAKAVASLESFHALLKRYSYRLSHSPRQLAECMRDLIGEIHYESEIQKQYKSADQQLARSDILDQFLDSMSEYAQRAEQPSPSDYLDDIALNGRDDESDKEDQLAEDAIKLMTLHSAKGLEFPRVYLVGLEEGLLPHQRSVDADDETAIAEERRLAYVGVTRAEDHLTISRANSRMKWGRRRPSIPSRFLFEMREDFCPELEFEIEF